MDSKKAEIIQQWQLWERPRAELLSDGVLADAKGAGITSLESYVLWSEIEKEPGVIDFSTYDVLVEKIKKHGLKWTPFLILGPYYATPKWFRDSQGSAFYKCLEHQKQSGDQSIWNPVLPKYIERFLSELARHYRDKNIFESILLGVAGNWGEAIYPTGGFQLGKFHSHDGFWAGDQYGKKSFVNFILQKYQTLTFLNSAWGTNFKDSSQISFPLVKESKKRLLLNLAISFCGKNPEFLKDSLKFILSKIIKKPLLFVSRPNSQPESSGSGQAKKHWLDFIEWYLGSMTDYAEFWIKTCRRYFPDNKIYLVTGGLGDPITGADFVGQTKAAQKYGAGIRITNQTNDYGQSFIQTRLVSSAARFYNAYFTTEEEAILVTPEGLTMRVFDAVSSGASGFYCRNIISQGKIPFVPKEKLAVGKLTLGAENLKKYLGLFNFQKPEIKTAVFFPNASIAFDFSLVVSLYSQCVRLRDVLDFDLVDETMIKDGALEKYKYLLVLAGELPKIDFPGGLKIVHDPKEIPNKIDNEYDGVYATKFFDRILYYNSNNKTIKKHLPFLNKTVEIGPKSISEIKL